MRSGSPLSVLSITPGEGYEGAIMNTNLLTLGLLAGLAFTGAAADKVLHSFDRIQLSDKFWAEGANFGDLNNDGVNDVVAGPYIYTGPDFKERRNLYPAKTTFKKKGADGTTVEIEGFEGALGVANKYSDN